MLMPTAQMVIITMAKMPSGTVRRVNVPSLPAKSVMEAASAMRDGDSIVKLEAATFCVTAYSKGD
ncbi:hypothetical protein GCM10025858_17950 [Alicyclobacillus sacchari]|nr:hypothetical protein GCM10025858_17950 [Alicyclobacillus sacchari]